MEHYDEIRVRELTENGDWPWRFVVEGLTQARWRKRWPWSREAKVFVPGEWKRLRHGRRDYAALQFSDASALAHHYRTHHPANKDKD